MSGVRATKSGDAFRLEQKFEEVYKTSHVVEFSAWCSGEDGRPQERAKGHLMPLVRRLGLGDL